MVGYCWHCECGGDGFCKGGYFIVVGVLYFSVCCVMVVVVLVGFYWRL